MSTLKSTYYSDIFEGFQAIPQKDYSRKIRYIEKYWDSILNMDEESMVEMVDHYTSALFEIGHYQKCIDKLQPFLSSFLEFRYYADGYDRFTASLMRKACSYYNLDLFDKSEHIIKEIIKITPENQDAVKILRSLHYRQIRNKTTGLRALSIMFLFIGAILICIDLLIIKNFYAEIHPTFMAFRNTFIILVAFGVIGMELYALVISLQRSKKYQAKYLAKKSNKPDLKMPI